MTTQNYVLTGLQLPRRMCGPVTASPQVCCSRMPSLTVTERRSETQPASPNDHNMQRLTQAGKVTEWCKKTVAQLLVQTGGGFLPGSGHFKRHVTQPDLQGVE